MTGVIIAAVIAFIVVSIVLARSTSSRKKQAMASLEEERKAVGRYSIVDLVDAEVSDLGLRSITGAEGIAPDVLLKTWADTPDVHDCEREHVRYELAPGIAPGDADVGDVTLVCDSHGSSNAGMDEPDGGTDPDGSEPTA